MRPPQTGVFGGVQQIHHPRQGFWGGSENGRSGPDGTGPVPETSPVILKKLLENCRCIVPNFNND
jgi:hypothetical protein